MVRGGRTLATTTTTTKTTSTRPIVPSWTPPFSHNHHTNESTHYHVHAIPNHLIFTHQYNLLPPFARTHQATPTRPNWDTLPLDQQVELEALQDNVAHTLQLHPTARAYFWTNADCQASLQRVLPALVPYFRHEPVGMFKADLCRGAALYELGGLYVDVDLGVRLNLWTVLDRTTTFATVRVHRHSNHVGAFFQAFMAVTPQHEIVWEYLQQFLQYYRLREERQQESSAKGITSSHTTSLTTAGTRFEGLAELDPQNDPLGVILLKRAFDHVLSNKNESRTNATELSSLSSSNVSLDTIQLWQEVDHAELLIPYSSWLDLDEPPSWNYQKRACRMIVVAKRLSSSKPSMVVPFYSRIANSRHCPTAPKQSANATNQ